MLRTETRFALAALQLSGALDLAAGSCPFEEGTCGFDSVFEFLPWILNEEGKGPRGEGTQTNFLLWLPSPWSLTPGTLTV